MLKYYTDKNPSQMVELFISNYLKTTGWLTSIQNKEAVNNTRPIPWYTYPALSFLSKIVSRDMKVFEYGCGNSTLWWADHAKSVYSVEHDKNYIDYIQTKLPSNAMVAWSPEDTPVDDVYHGLTSDLLKIIPEPVINFPHQKMLARGLLNKEFLAYAIEAFRHGPYDIIVIDGMARVLTACLAADLVRDTGIIIFDNSDREEYSFAYEYLEKHGFVRIDFWGPGPVNPYEWCTSFFLKKLDVLTRTTRTGAVPKVCELNLKNNFGILLIGHMRPMHLQAVLESLRQQDALSMTHVWIDGTADRLDLSLSATEMCVKVVRNFTVRELRDLHGHMGIEKLMLDGLEFMAKHYDTFLIIEDDCFPCHDAVSVFRKELKAIKTDSSVFSVYGHHFGTKSERDTITRFQGWGWGSTADKINAHLPLMRKLFNLNEKDYLSYIENALSHDACEHLDITPGRNVLDVLQKFFSWDSCLALITAQNKQLHKKTPKKTIYNFGLNTGSGHFNSQNDALRRPPFNMVTLDEVWDCFYDQTYENISISINKEYYGLDELDRLIACAIDLEHGFFVELGAFDGVTQNNSLYFEKRGWKGLLIEPAPSAYGKCRLNRPDAIVVNAACVPFSFEKDYIEIFDVGLMSTVDGSMTSDIQETWLERGEGFHIKPRQKLYIPAKPLSVIIEENNISVIDLLILDVEGSEINVLQGFDFEKHAPKYIVVEDKYEDETKDFLSGKGYLLDRTLLERKYTRDRLYIKKEGGYGG